MADDLLLQSTLLQSTLQSTTGSSFEDTMLSMSRKEELVDSKGNFSSDNVEDPSSSVRGSTLESSKATEKIDLINLLSPKLGTDFAIS